MAAKLLEQCIDVYDAMVKHSEEWIEDEADVLCYKGMLTKLFTKMEWGTANYSRIVGMLKSMGCVEQVRRGSGTTEGIWLLWKRPDEELFNWVKEAEAFEKGSDKGGPNDSVEQRLRDIQELVLGLRETVKGHTESIEALEDIVLEDDLQPQPQPQPQPEEEQLYES